MHIPDGYLSPSTCAALYGASVPFWYVSLRRMKRLAGTRLIPLISVFAAFSFVIMMFNLPLPGGTTGHAIGIGIASVVLGPWGAMAAISIALAIQAVFFGDGGLTALGANCFNMGVAGSLVAYFVYRLLAAKSELTSGRRVVAAAFAGYAAINAAALLAAVEFGVQPLWFHDSAGVPLYCPYPLAVSIPAMMIGHLTFAGLAELTISAGVVRYLQIADIALLRTTAPGVAFASNRSGNLAPSFGVPRGFWIGLAALLILSPLGILATGSAWGEWSAEDFRNPQTRTEIAAASGREIPTARAPRGLERLSTVWNAPIASYAPRFASNESIGYLFSALFGTGIVILLCIVFNWLFSLLPKRRMAQRGFVEKTVGRLLRAVERSLFAEQIAMSKGLLQGMDARVKLASLLILMVAAAGVRKLTALALLLALSIVLATFSGVSIMLIAKRAWIPALAVSGFVALPALFITPGPVAFSFPLLDISVTFSGLRAAAFLLGRVFTAATLSLLLVLTTEWNRILKSMRFFRIPVPVVFILGMTYRYLFVLLRTASEIFEARRTRLIGVLEETERQRLAAASAGILLQKSIALSEDIHLAMQARGFRGEVYLLHEPPLRLAGWLQITAFFAAGCAAFLWGR